MTEKYDTITHCRPDYLPWEQRMTCRNGESQCNCGPCQNANRIEAEGLEYCEEYEKASLRNFDRSEA